MLVSYREAVCRKVMGGRRPLWHAESVMAPRVVGAGNTADNAIKDLQRQARAQFLVTMRPLPERDAV